MAGEVEVNDPAQAGFTVEQEGLVDRSVVPDTPVRVEYSLTKKGKALAEAIGSIAAWAEKYVAIPEQKTKSRKR